MFPPVITNPGEVGALLGCSAASGQAEQPGENHRANVNAGTHFSLAPLGTL